MIQLALASVGAGMGWFLGGGDGLIYALLIFVAMDYLTGVMRAATEKRLSSAVGFKGLCRKLLIFLLVGLGHMLDTYVLGTGSALRTAAIFFYLANEGLSLTENAAALGLPVPQKLRSALEQLHGQEDKEE